MVFFPRYCPEILRDFVFATVSPKENKPLIFIFCFNVLTCLGAKGSLLGLLQLASHEAAQMFLLLCHVGAPKTTTMLGD